MDDKKCKWCNSGQRFVDLDDGSFECVICNPLRIAIEGSPDEAWLILDLIMNGALTEHMRGI